MTVAEARDLGHSAAGDAIFMSHCNPALHALVGILRISPRQVALQLGITPGRMSHYINKVDPIPYERRKSIVDLLAIALDALGENIAFARLKAKGGEWPTEPYTEGCIGFSEAQLIECHRLLRLEQKALEAEAAAA